VTGTHSERLRTHLQAVRVKVGDHRWCLASTVWSLGLERDAYDEVLRCIVRHLTDHREPAIGTLNTIIAVWNSHRSPDEVLAAIDRALAVVSP
jgi:hypothetical protein